jgi:hypothetical protein
MLVNFMISMLCFILDVIYLRGDDYDQEKQDVGCRITGTLSVFSEISATIRLVWVSYLVKRMVTSPTSNFKVLSIIANVSIFLGALIFVIIIFFTFGFSVSVSLIMKVKFTCSKTKKVDIFDFQTFDLIK